MHIMIANHIQDMHAYHDSKPHTRQPERRRRKGTMAKQQELFGPPITGENNQS